MNGKKPPPRYLSWVAPLALLALLVGAWAFASVGSGSHSPFFPTVSDFTSSATSLLGQGWYWQRVLTTFGEALLGSLVGAAVAIPCSWLIYKSAVVNAALQPFLGATQAIPAVALAPLLVLWVGRGLGAIVFLCALMVFFPILVSTTVGLRHLDRDIMDAAALDGASGFLLIWSIELPLVTPSLLAGVRNGFTLSVTGAVVGEMVMGGAGLGQQLVQQQHNLDTAGMFVTVFVLCVLAMIAYSLVYFVERRGKRRVDATVRPGSTSVR